MPPDRLTCPQEASALPKHVGRETGVRTNSRLHRREASLLVVLVAVVHLVAAISLAQLAPAPPQPDRPPIVVALISPAGDASSSSHNAAVPEQQTPATPEPAITQTAAPERPQATPPEPQATPPKPQATTAAPSPPVNATTEPPPPPKPVAVDKPKPKPRPPRDTPPSPPKPQQPKQSQQLPASPAPATTSAPALTAAPASTAAPAAETGSKAASASAAPAPSTAARFDAGYLNNPAPAYPPLARRMQEQGKVLLRVHVSADGKPGKIELSSSSGSDRLDAAARAAVARWRFIPARQGDKDVEAWVIVPIIFKLEGS